MAGVFGIDFSRTARELSKQEVNFLREMAALESMKAARAGRRLSNQDEIQSMQEVLTQGTGDQPVPLLKSRLSTDSSERIEFITLPHFSPPRANADHHSR